MGHEIKSQSRSEIEKFLLQVNDDEEFWEFEAGLLSDHLMGEIFTRQRLANDSIRIALLIATDEELGEIYEITKEIYKEMEE